MRTNPQANAVITTVLFAGTLGVLIAVTGFGVIRIVEEMVEALRPKPLTRALKVAYFGHFERDRAEGAGFSPCAR